MAGDNNINPYSGGRFCKLLFRLVPLQKKAYFPATHGKDRILVYLALFDSTDCLSYNPSLRDKRFLRVNHSLQTSLAGWTAMSSP